MAKPGAKERFTPNRYTPRELFAVQGSGKILFDLPPFQRDYSWGVERWRDLWRDIVRKADGESSSPQHFLGILLLQDTGEAARAGVTSVRVIDGQQRLLTLAVLLAALKDEGAHLDVNPQQVDGRARWTGQNEDTLRMLDRIWQGDLANGLPKDAWQSPLAMAYRFFRYQLRVGRPTGQDVVTIPPRLPGSHGVTVESFPKLAPKSRQWQVRSLIKAVQERIVTVAIHLPAEEEEATGVFESLNGANTPLREFDKVRVLLYTRAEGKQSKAYREQWLPAESTLLRTRYRGKVRSIGDQFLYDYTVAWIGDYWVDQQPAADRTHEVVKEFALRKAGKSTSSFVKHVLKPMAVAAKLYPLAVGADEELEQAVVDYDLPESAARAIKAITAYSSGPLTPLILRSLTEWWETGSSAELVKRLQLIEAAMLRILLTGQKLSPLRSEMIRLSRQLYGGFTTASLRLGLRKVLDRMEVDDDLHIAKSAETTDLYGVISTSALGQIIRSIDHFRIKNVKNELALGGRKKDFTIEHIFPKVETVPAAWRREYRDGGRGAAELQSAHELRHTLGNLILLQRADNSGFGTKSFVAKRDLLKSHTEPLLMYGRVTIRSAWTEQAIRARGRAVAKELLAARPI